MDINDVSFAANVPLVIYSDVGREYNGPEQGPVIYVFVVVRWQAGAVYNVSGLSKTGNLASAPPFRNFHCPDKLESRNRPTRIH